MKFDANGWLDVAVEVDYLSKSMSRQGHKITHICLHGTAGGTSAEGIANYFATSDVEASAHIVIDQQGNVAQGVPLSLAAWGNGIITAGHAPWIREDTNPNFYTVSIEHCKAHDDNSDTLTAIQQQKSFEVVKCICETYGIPKRAGDASGGIISHADIDPVNRKRCPGLYPWQELFSYLKGGTTPVATTPTVNQQKAADDCWDSVLKNNVTGPAPKGTGIYSMWLQALASSKFYGPPLTHEYNTIDWNGNAIIAQEFSRARCEWKPGSGGGLLGWYSINGKI